MTVIAVRMIGKKDNMLEEERSEDVSTDYEGETLLQTTKEMEN